MKKIITLLLLIAFPLACPALADGLPDHYPEEGFGRTGRVDAVYKTESRIVIDDFSYRLSKSAIIHSLSAKRVPLARIRPGALVAYRTGSDRMIEELWLLPANYSRTRRR